MTDSKGNKWTIWLAGILTTLVLFIAIPTMASNMITNEKTCATRHNKNLEKVTATQLDIREIKTTLVYMQDEQRKAASRDERILNKLDKLAG